MKRLGGGGFTREREGRHSSSITRLLSALALVLTTQTSADTFTLLDADQTAWVEEDMGYHWAHTGETFDTPSRLRTDTRGHLVLVHPNLRITLPERSEITINAECHKPGCGYLKNILFPRAHPQLGHPCTVPSVRHHRGTMFVQIANQPISIQAQNVRVDALNAVFALSTSYSLGQRISVLEGKVKVKNANCSIMEVAAEESLRTGDEITPTLCILNSAPDTVAHWKGLHEFKTGILESTSKVPEIILQQEFGKSPAAIGGKAQAEAPQ